MRATNWSPKPFQHLRHAVEVEAQAQAHSASGRSILTVTRRGGGSLSVALPTATWERMLAWESYGQQDGTIVGWGRPVAPLGPFGLEFSAGPGFSLVFYRWQPAKKAEGVVLLFDDAELDGLMAGRVVGAPRQVDTAALPLFGAGAIARRPLLEM